MLYGRQFCFIRETGLCVSSNKLLVSFRNERNLWALRAAPRSSQPLKLLYFLLFCIQKRFRLIVRKAGKTLRTHFSLGRVGCHPSVDFSCSWLTPVLQPVLRQPRRQKEDTWNLFLFVLAATFCLLMLRVGMTPMSVPPLPQLLSVQSHGLHRELQKYLTGNCSLPYTCLCLGSSDTKDKTCIKPSFWPGKCQQDPVQWRLGKGSF